ncbi:lipid-binding SYLF domain-containing protein [Kaarinaea lacus]
MNASKLAMAYVLISLLLTGNAFADEFAATINTFKESPEVQSFFKKAYAYAVFPTVGKGGFGIGVAHGKGKVYVGGKVTGKTSVTQVSIGAQVGGQAYSQMIFFQDKRAYEEFTSGNFEFSAQASAIAITSGAQAQAGTTGKSASANAGPRDAGAQRVEYHKGMAVFVHAKGGFMYEASLGGQKYNFEPIKKSE